MAPFRLDQNSALPLHAQVQQFVRELAQQDEYQNGAFLPDEITLANRLGISRGTMRAGIAQLVHEGLLERKPGRGTRVISRQFQSGIGAWRSFTAEMKKKGIDVETFQLTTKLAPVSESVGRALQLEPGTMAVRLDRLRGWSGDPIVHSRSWLHPRLGLTVDADFTRPLYELIESQCAVIVEHAREEIEAVAAPAAIATLLQIPKGRPVLLRRHTVFDPGDRPIEHAEVHYRSDRFTLTLDIRKDSK